MEEKSDEAKNPPYDQVEWMKGSIQIQFNLKFSKFLNLSGFSYIGSA